MKKNKSGKKVNEVFQYYSEKKKEEISEFCNDNGKIVKSAYKNIGVKFFFILFGSVLGYTSFYQLLIPELLASIQIEIWQGMVTIFVSITIFLIFFAITYLKKSFGTMRWLIYGVFYIGVTIISNLFFSLMFSIYDFGIYEIYVRFGVGIIFSFSLVLVSYIVTRKIICHVDIIEL